MRPRLTLVIRRAGCVDFQTYGRYKRGPFFDTERQMSCEPHILGDGTVGCTAW
jgi:hypothetical protein